jgi:hypothetical protein
MPIHPLIKRRALFALTILSGAVVSLACDGEGVREAGGASNTPPRPRAPVNHTAAAGGTRVVLIYDPTAYLHADTSLVTQQVFEPLKQFVAGLPRNTIVDSYIVAQDGLNRPPDRQDTLPFVGRESNANAHKRRAMKAAEQLSAQGMEKWAAARQRVKQPASCILSTLRRTRASLEQAAIARERVAIVLVSDLLEVCDDFGRFNFEVAIPDSFGPLPDRVDFSQVDAVHIVGLEHPRITDVSAATRLDSVWVGLVRSWGAPAEDVSLRSTYPGRLFRPAASAQNR